jgi:hypothetical protein
MPQNGNPPQNPAAPELMLSARPSTNTVTSNEAIIPDIISIFSADIFF